MNQIRIFSYVINSYYFHKRVSKTFWDSFKNSEIIHPYSFKGLEKEFDLPGWWLEKDSGILKNDSNEKNCWMFNQNYMNLLAVLGNISLDDTFLILDNTSTVVDMENLDKDILNIYKHLPEDWDIIFLSGYVDSLAKINKFISKPGNIDLTNSFLVRNRSIPQRLRKYIINHPCKKYFGDYLNNAVEDLNLKCYISNKKLFYPFGSSSYYSNKCKNYTDSLNWTSTRTNA